ncbi:MAG: MFS transporter [Eubacteriales bacterium]|nr:MFS transporter [Eubacteriales bacterium]
MKLNYKRTLLIGLAFMSISSFWQLYDPVIPKILKNTFHLSEVWQGIIMALDNILAVFLLPFFGSLSDKTHFKMGKRMPYILTGTAIAVVLMILLPLADKAKSLGAFIAILFVLLLAMGLYRSPAVSLMSDLTHKPLRSKANGLINLMGAVGGVFTLILMQFAIGKYPDGRENFSVVFLCVALFMVACVTALYFTIKENKLAAELQIGPEEEEDHEKMGLSGFKALSKQERSDLLLILFSIFFWFVGYNAVTTNFSKFAEVKWQSSTAQAATSLLIASVGAIISYIPVGHIATKIGRKRTIQMGVILLSACFLSVTFLQSYSPVLYILFLLVGLAWALINVNSLPMVVEICKPKDIGKFTGYYYTFSMSAQIVTPVLAGLLIDLFGYNVLMPYAAIAVAISFFTISKAKSGDSKTA